MEVGRSASKGFRWSILVPTLMLAGIGLLNLYSALHSWGDTSYLHLFWMQCVWVGIGILLMMALMFFDYRFLDQIGWYLYILSNILLLLVLFFGKEVAGHRSWLGIGSLGIQPTEIAKLALVFALAKFFTNNPNPGGFTFGDLLKPALITFVPMTLIVLQGDFGSAMFFVLILFSFAWFAKIRGRTLFSLFTIGLVVSLFLYFFALSGYQRARVMTFLHPEQDTRGQGYQLTQSKIAIGSGAIFGKGYLKGSVNKLKYLPEKHTDFAFPVLAEEWGFFGSIITLGLYFFLLINGIDVARNSRDRLGIFLAVGVVAFLFWQIAINLGGVLGLIPLTGVTLPFISYGGSSILVMMSAIGLLLNISLKRYRF